MNLWVEAMNGMIHGCDQMRLDEQIEKNVQSVIEATVVIHRTVVQGNRFQSKCENTMNFPIILICSSTVTAHHSLEAVQIQVDRHLHQQHDDVVSAVHAAHINHQLEADMQNVHQVQNCINDDIHQVKRKIIEA